MRKLGFYAARRVTDNELIYGSIADNADNAKCFVSIAFGSTYFVPVHAETIRENVIFREDGNHVFNGDIVELFDCGIAHDKSLGFGVVTFNRQQCQYDIDMLEVDCTGRPNGIDDRYDLFRTRPQPTGYNAFDKELPLKFSDAFSYVDRHNFNVR